MALAMQRVGAGLREAARGQSTDVVGRKRAPMDRALRLRGQEAGMRRPLNLDRST